MPRESSTSQWKQESMSSGKNLKPLNGLTDGWEINSKSIYEESNFPESGEGREMGWHINSCQSRRPTCILKVKKQRLAGSRQESCRRALEHSQRVGDKFSGKSSWQAWVRSKIQFLVLPKEKESRGWWKQPCTIPHKHASAKFPSPCSDPKPDQQIIVASPDRT